MAAPSTSSSSHDRTGGPAEGKASAGDAATAAEVETALPGTAGCYQRLGRGSGAEGAGANIEIASSLRAISRDGVLAARLTTTRRPRLVSARLTSPRLTLTAAVLG